ncbi:piggyBac transposable element-derived protein 4-like [Ixodes scapularis]
MAAFAPRSFYGNSSRDFVESDDDFSEEDNYVPPSDDDETSSADCSDSSDEEVCVQDDNNSGPSSPRAPALSSWTAYTDDLPDFPDVAFTVSDPGSQVGSSNLGSELEFFQLFFTDELIGEIVQETNRHAHEKISSMDSLAEQSIWKSWEDVSVEEFKAFLGVLMNMALNPKPDVKEYFSQEILKKMPFFPVVFTRTRFLQIFWMLHVSPPPQGPSHQPTRGSKVRNIVKYIDTKCREHSKPGPKICVDESTVGFKGRVSFKCYNPQKPTKWGLRVYVLADCRTGYVSAFEPYYGSTTTESLCRPDLPFTCRIVLHLLDKVQCASLKSGYHLYTDRFYTSPQLAEELLSQDVLLTGTVMTNRKHMPQQLKKKMKKGDVAAYRKGDSYMALAWQDKRQVTMLSSAHNPSTKPVTRTQAHGQAVTLDKPVVICDYTENMGAVDRADHYCASYAFCRKSLKWWRKLFFLDP